MKKNNNLAPVPKLPLSLMFRRSWQLWVMMLPAIILLFIFAYIPMYGVQIAFRDYRPGLGFFGSPWVGLKHILRFIYSYNFWEIMRNTIWISFYGLIAGFPIPIILAIALNASPSQRFKKIVQLVTYAPHFISTVVMVGMIVLFLDPIGGMVNQFINLFGGKSLNFLAQPQLFSSIYVWSGVWQGMGWGAIIYLAVLSQVSQELYEAAIIDGASILQRIWYIEIPTLAPTVTILLILSTGSILSVGFEKIFLLQNPINMGVSEVISTYVYRVGLGSQIVNFSYSAAIGTFQAVISLILLLTVDYVSKKISKVSFFY